jgi:alkyl hydroperoxide reductase subunit AhpC
VDDFGFIKWKSISKVCIIRSPDIRTVSVIFYPNFDFSFECTHDIQSDQQESKSEQALQIIGHVVAKSYAHKRSKHGRRQFMVLNAT